jgi:type IV pilus assembly protein PilM
VLVPENTNLKAGVEFDFETHVPLPPGEALFDYEPIRRVEAGTIVAVTAYAKRIVNQYTSVFHDAGITPRSFEVESQALARAAVRESDRSKVVMLIDFGRRTTRIAVVEYGVVAFTATVDIGGDTLTTAVMKVFNVPEAEAEEIKNNKGFLMNKDNKNLVEALMTTVSVMKDEIVKHITYWNTPPADDLPRKPIEKIIMCGGNANLRGFLEYLEGSVSVPVSMANVWANAFSLDEYVPQMQISESLEYSTAIGLAIRDVVNPIW